MVAYRHTYIQTHIHSRAGVSSYYLPLEHLTGTEEGWSGNGVFCLMSSLSLKRTHKLTDTGPEVLIIQGRPLDNPVLKLRWDDIKRPVSLLNSLGSTQRQSLIEKKTKRKSLLHQFSELAVELEFRKPTRSFFIYFFNDLILKSLLPTVKSSFLFQATSLDCRCLI